MEVDAKITNELKNEESQVVADVDEEQPTETGGNAGPTTGLAAEKKASDNDDVVMTQQQEAEDDSAKVEPKTDKEVAVEAIAAGKKDDNPEEEKKKGEETGQKCEEDVVMNEQALTDKNGPEGEGQQRDDLNGTNVDNQNEEQKDAKKD